MQLTIALMTYNRSTYLSDAIEAALGQTYSNFELLIFDNHSTDDTPNVVLGFHDPRITYIRQPSGLTADASFCGSIWMSRTKYILVTHDDDIMEPTLVEHQLALISKHPRLLCVASNVSLIDEQNNIIQPRLYNDDCDRIFRLGEYIMTYLEEKLWLPTPTCMYNRDAMLKVLKLIHGENWLRKKMPTTPSGDILINFYLNTIGSLGLLAAPLLRYRQHSGQESRNVHQGKPVVDILRVMKKLGRVNGVLNRVSRHVNAALARFETQNLFFRLPRLTDIRPLTRGVDAIRSRLEREIPDDQRALDAIIPFEISLRVLRLKPLCRPGTFRKILRTGAHSGARQGFRNWLRVIQAGYKLFDSHPQLDRIAIFGSMMVAFLIVLEARRAGIDVLCCVDSSPARIGGEVFGVPILSPADFRRFDERPDAVILSNERDHEDAIRKLLAQHIPDPNVKVLSWKELAANTLELATSGVYAEAAIKRGATKRHGARLRGYTAVALRAKAGGRQVLHVDPCETI